MSTSTNAGWEDPLSEARRIEAEILGLGSGHDPFAAAVRATRMPMCISDPRLPDNPIVFANDSFCRLAGYPRAEILGRNCRFLQGPETDRAIVARVREAIEARRPIEIDIRNYRKNGEAFWNRLLMAPVFDQAGELVYFFASQVDVTIQQERLAFLETDNASLTVEVAARLNAQRESEARLRVATEAARIGVWEIHLPARVLTSTPTLNAVYGLPEDARPSYEAIRALAHPDDLARVVEAFGRAITGEAEYDVTYRTLRPDGRTAWIEVRGRVVRDTEGAPSRILGASRDVTERRRAAERLELSEESLRLATEAAEVGTWDLDLRTGLLTWSDRTKAMFGISPDVPCSMDDFYAGLHAEDRDSTGRAFAAAIDPARRLTYDVEYRTVGKEDGVIRWVAAKGKGLFAGDVCARALGTAIDITARRRAERRQAFLLALADELRALADPQAIKRAAMHGLGRELGVERVGYGQVQEDDATVLLETGFVNGVQALNGSFALDSFGPETIARQRAGQSVVCPDVLLDPRLDHETWRAIDARAFISVPLIREGRFRASLFINRRLAGEWPAEDVTLTEAVAERTWDAVERARAEAEVRELNATLERRVEERTAELVAAEDALRQAQKMEAVGQLTGGIAHDFNNMLGVVLGSLELLRRRLSADDGRAKRYVDAAHEGARRAANLTQRLLAFSRQQPLQPEPVDANRLVTGMSNLLGHSLGGAVQLETVLAGGLWPIHVDPNQLENVILNLGINARDAMPDGGRLTIETQNAHLDSRYTAAEVGLAAGQYVLIAVTDTGAGMTQEVIAKAFDPFFTTKGVGKGTGLGLSQVYGFVKQSGGHVRIYSELGHGTTVKLYLPRLVGRRFASEATEAGDSLALGDARELILVVEDEPAVRAFTVDVLGELGYRVLQSDGAAGALRLLEERRDIVLLFTDIVMPEVNGARLAEAAKALRPDLKVLFTTGYTRNAVVHNGVVDPGVELIGKPFTVEELAARVRQVLDQG